MPYEVTFDGRAKAQAGSRAAGAAAILWGHPLHDGSRTLLARALVSLPEVPHAQEAEAWGATLAVDLLASVPGPLRKARIIGDNLAVVRYGAEKGHLHRPEIHRPLASALAAAAERGWHLKWQAVRRRLNKAADAAATEAVLAAHARRREGQKEPVVTVQHF